MLTKTTGFWSNDPCILINAGGNTFYYMENDTCRRITFNLPQGEYDVKSDIKPLARPLRYKCPKLPEREKMIPIKEIEVRIGRNKNKASIDVRSGAILIDSQFIKNICEQKFISGHELGHFLYRTEWKCDLFSAKLMLENGYNPSQCFYSNAFCLSDKQEERKDILLTWLKKVKVYE